MKSFFTVSLVVSAASAASNKTLEEVYGPAKSVENMTPWAQRTTTRDFPYTEDYYKVRLPENCVFPLEIVIVQDATASFQDDYAIMRDVQLGLMVNALNASHPGSKFSVTSFRDKPVWSLGDVSDYCQRFEAPLSDNTTKLYDVYGKLVSTGGADPAENQFGAIVATCQSDTPGWSAADTTSVRLVVLSTDAYPHFADDGFNTYGMSPFSGVFDEENAVSQCLKEYYPSPAQLKTALERRHAYLAQLIFDGDWQNGLVRRAWEWTNNYLEQTPGFLEPLANDASNFWTALSDIIEKIEDAECVPQTTSTTGRLLSTQTVTTPTTTETIPTTPPSVTAVGTTEETEEVCSCPPCAEESHDPCACPCDDSEVLIQLSHRPKSLQLVINNEEQAV